MEEVTVMTIEERRHMLLVATLRTTAVVCGSDLKGPAAHTMASHLRDYSTGAVYAALRHIERTHTGRLSLADIIFHIDDPKAPMSIN